MSLSFCVATHAGVRRHTNEDSCLARPDLGLFVVADGVGGYAAGEIASRGAVEAVEQAVAETAGRTASSEWPFDYQPALGVDGNRLNWAFHQANTRVRAEAEAGRDRQGLATTVAAVLFESGPAGVVEPLRGATIGHVGDSRIYRFRGAQLDRLTRDHSWVEEQVQAGAMSVREARTHPRRNLLTRALTGAADPAADLAWAPTVPGDRLLLCSDGLHAVLTDEQIAAILRQDVEAAEAEADSVCAALVHAANLAGGPDNITVVIIRL